MKKKLYALLVVLVSCSSNDNSSSSTSVGVPPPESNIQIYPKTIKFTRPNDPNSSTITTFLYVGNQILSSLSSSISGNPQIKRDYSYQGNLIVSITTSSYVSGNWAINGTTTYSYDSSNRLIAKYLKLYSSQYPNGKDSGRAVYTYNTDNTVKEEGYSTNLSTGVETKNFIVYVYSYANNNLVKIVRIDTSNNTTTTDVFDYDNKNNPYRNVLGFSQCNLTSPSYCSVNNVLKETYIDSKGATTVTTTSYTYDANGYVTKETDTNYFFEYAY